MPSFTTTPEQQEQLLTDGFVSLPGAVPPNVVEHWRDLADKFESAALEAHSRSERLRGACVIEDPVGPRLMRQDDLLGIEPEAALDLLACPMMLAVSRDFCGPGTVPLQMDLLYKHQHPHPVILWHQGAQHPRGFPYLNVGIYLDDADEGLVAEIESLAGRPGVEPGELDTARGHLHALFGQVTLRPKNGVLWAYPTLKPKKPTLKESRPLILVAGA